ncbi:MAG TPA: ketol-acid reductoisomerase [bacterium]|nr:ketol-acid reductoisomerase [bacterium]
MIRAEDADPPPPERGPVGVVGYGNQGAAQAHCLRDSGCAVRVFVRSGPSADRARTDGFPPASPGALADCRSIGVLVPDEAVDDVAGSLLHPHAPEGALLVFAHGFAPRAAGPAAFREDLDLALVGPLGPGTLLRERFVAGQGLPGLFAVLRDVTGRAEERALAWAAGIGAARAGLLATDLDEEVVSDLFTEQAVLVGGVVELMRAAWDTLTEAGISEDVAYYSCVQELKQMLDLVHRHGPAGMRDLISGTARYGALTRGPRVVGDETRRAMRAVLEEIRSGEFAREWLAEHRAGGAGLRARTEEEARRPWEEAGERVRRHLGH